MIPAPPPTLTSDMARLETVGPTSQYVVVSGDTLSAIAQAHGITLAALEVANPQILDPNRIIPGESVLLPGAAPKVQAVPEPVTGHYTVTAGDTLAKIAQAKYHNANLWPALWFLNKAIVRNPNALVQGQVLDLSTWHPSDPAITAEAISAIPKPAVSITITTWHEPYTTKRQGYVTNVSYGSADTAGWSAYKMCVWSHESGDGTNMQNPTSTASGDFGFLTSTWWDVTHLPGPARDYSLATQSAAFDKLYAEAGRSPWGTDGC